MSISKKFFFAFALVALVSMLPDLAHANASNLIGNGICAVVSLVTSKVGKGIATLAIIFLGIGAFFGKVNWGLALMVSIGIIAIFGAAVIANYIADSATGNAGQAGC